MANEYTLSLTGVEADQFALAKKVYDSRVVAFLEPELLAYSMVPTEDFGGAVSKDIVRFYKLTAQQKKAHAELAKQTMVKKVITLRLEDEETTAAANFSKRDQMITHFDAQGNLARASAQALGQLYEVQTLCQGILAARTAADGNFPGGQQVIRTGSATISTQYPESIVGSKRLQLDIKQALRAMFEDNVPSGEKYCFMKKREYDVFM